MPPIQFLAILLELLMMAMLTVLLYRTRLREIALRQRLKDLEGRQRGLDHSAALPRLAGTVAHDLNNLLTVITGHAEMLTVSNPDEDPSEGGRLILDAAVKAGNLTQRLLAFSRPTAQVTMPINLNIVLATIHRTLQGIVGEHITVEMLPAPELSSVQADPGMIERFILELAYYARTRLPRGGTLQIATRETPVHPADGLFDDNGLAVGDYVELVLVDSAVAPANINQLFNPDGVEETAALARAAGSLGGRIIAEAVPRGNGLRIRLLMPTIIENPQLQPAPAAAFHRGQGTILVVEDSDDLLNYIHRALENLGYEVLVARGAEEALYQFRRAADRIKLVISDVMMPGESGVKLCTRFRSIDPNIPILYISGYSAESLESECRIGPQDHLLTKPFTVEELAGRVHRMVTV